MASKLLKIWGASGGICLLAVIGIIYASKVAYFEKIEDQKPKNVASAMSGKDARFMKTEEIYKSARIQVGQFVPDEARQSFPIPVRRSDGIKLIFLFCPSFNSPAGSQMYPPNYLVRLDVLTGKMEERKKVAPQDFAQTHNPNEPVGLFVLPRRVSVNEYLEKRARLFELYDDLLPAFAAGKAASNSEIRRQATEFVSLFSLLKEPPLIDYYAAVGREFFDWLRR